MRHWEFTGLKAENAADSDVLIMHASVYDMQLPIGDAADFAKLAEMISSRIDTRAGKSPGSQMISRDDTTRRNSARRPMQELISQITLSHKWKPLTRGATISLNLILFFLHLFAFVSQPIECLVMIVWKASGNGFSGIDQKIAECDTNVDRFSLGRRRKVQKDLSIWLTAFRDFE